ncbi:FimB/Mfa2 family fimbrial subunit [Segatella paludivivens]|uniref:FimB/Mfa2 family fimbrial subunit n=1 Tax=Segatella paludivivens TaxID=185294 RepID=UPI0003797CB2|nr:FimB/Mfa2 family fimbrial subunit [Segatella paludivivens]
MRNGIKTILIGLLLSMIMASCIYDEYPDRKQCDLMLNIVDSTGSRSNIPDSVAHKYDVYWFVNGIYKQTISAEDDGLYRLSFDKGDRITFVAIAAKDTAACKVNVPFVGESIKNVWLQLKTSSNNISPQPSAIYYGSIDTTATASDPTNNRYVISMKDVRSKISVRVNGLKERFGAGNYRIVVEGLRSGIAYDGSTSGELINYEFTGHFDSEGNYVTGNATVFASGSDERVRVRVYKQDGEMLFDRDVDEDNKPLIVNKRDDIVFVINASYSTGMTIKIVPWNEIPNPGGFQ